MSEKNIVMPHWVPNRDRGPWKNSLDFAISEDGLHFTKTGKTLVDHGGVPNMITDYKNNRIISSFQYFSFEKEEEFGKMAVCFSNDEGENWTRPKVINLDCPEEICKRACDPALVLFSDNKYRLYFLGHIPGAKPGIYSAISKDCINFKLEDGIRMMAKDKMVNDPTVVKIKDKWHYYSPIPKERGKNYHGVSDDGLNFTRVDDIILDMNMLGCALPIKGGYRFFGSGPKGMFAFTTDGYNWNQEDVKGPGPDPGVIQLKNGKYLMLYTAINLASTH